MPALVWPTLADTSRRVLHATLSVLLPARCQVCGGDTSPDAPLCADCIAQWPHLEAACPRCGDPTPLPADASPGDVCARCQLDPPPYHLARSMARYEGVAASAIRALKFADRPGVARPLGGLLAGALHEGLLPGPWDALVAVPLTPAKLSRRGYNQAALLAHALAAHVHLPVVPALARRAGGRAQKDQAAHRRRENVAAAFTPTPAAEALKGASVLLVDDVLTTGSTLRACTEILLATGVDRVDVLTVARAG